MSEENHQVAVVATSCPEEEQLLEYNSNLPITENRIEELFNQLDVDKAGAVRFEEAIDFYLSLEHFGLEPTDKEAMEYVSKFAATNPESLTYEEFACFILSIAQW